MKKKKPKTETSARSRPGEEKGKMPHSRGEKGDSRRKKRRPSDAGKKTKIGKVDDSGGKKRGSQTKGTEKKACNILRREDFLTQNSKLEREGGTLFSR